MQRKEYNVAIPQTDMNKNEDFSKSQTDHLVSIQLEGYEMLEKEVKASGNSGRVYLPNDWIGGTVKIIRITPIKTNKKN